MTATDTDTCTRPGCGIPAHGRGLCRIHYDELRYQRTTGGRSPEAEAARLREEWIEDELCIGGTVPEWVSPTGSMFASEAERREAWEERREELMTDYLSMSPIIPGNRPWAYWRYDARRRPGIWWLAKNGHLTEPEIEEIRREAEEAAPRIGTDEEQIGGLDDYADRWAVALHRAVQMVLEEGRKARARSKSKARRGRKRRRRRASSGRRHGIPLT